MINSIRKPLASPTEQMGRSGGMRRVSLAMRPYNASIGPSLIERATGHLARPCPCAHALRELRSPLSLPP